MKIAFKNGNEYEVQNLLEQKVFNNASSGWVIGFTFTANLNSSTLDSLLTAENISQLIIKDDESTENSTTVLGYDKVTSAVIRHATATSAIVEVQFSKGL